MIEIHAALIAVIFVVGSLAGYFVGLLDKGIRKSIKPASVAITGPSGDFLVVPVERVGDNPTIPYILGGYTQSMEIVNHRRMLLLPNGKIHGNSWLRWRPIEEISEEDVDDDCQ